jgi:hypothetical protein
MKKLLLLAALSALCMQTNVQAMPAYHNDYEPGLCQLLCEFLTCSYFDAEDRRRAMRAHRDAEADAVAIRRDAQRAARAFSAAQRETAREAARYVMPLATTQALSEAYALLNMNIPPLTITTFEDYIAPRTRSTQSHIRQAALRLLRTVYHRYEAIRPIPLRSSWQANRILNTIVNEINAEVADYRITHPRPHAVITRQAQPAGSAISVQPHPRLNSGVAFACSTTQEPTLPATNADFDEKDQTQSVTSDPIE